MVSVFGVTLIPLVFIVGLLVDLTGVSGQKVVIGVGWGVDPMVIDYRANRSSIQHNVNIAVGNRDVIDEPTLMSLDQASCRWGRIELTRWRR